MEITVEEIREVKEFNKKMDKLTKLYYITFLDDDFSNFIGWRLSGYEDKVIIEYEKCENYKEWYTTIEDLNEVSSNLENWSDEN